MIASQIVFESESGSALSPLRLFLMLEKSSFLVAVNCNVFELEYFLINFLNGNRMAAFRGIIFL